MVLRSKDADGTATVRPKSVWWMLLSHHAPCDFGRTWSFFGIRLCVRCLAVFLFACASFVWIAVTGDRPHFCSVILAAALTLPGWIDFALGELWPGYPKTNAFRFLTGAVFGIGLGVTAGQGVSAGQWLPLLVFIMTSCAVELAIAFAFYYCGHLEAYLDKYEDAVGIHAHHCH